MIKFGNNFYPAIFGMKNTGHFIKFLASWQMKKIKPNHPPFIVWVEPTNQCNLKCRICPNSTSLSRKKGFMPMERFNEIVEQLKGKVPMLNLHGGGEPLMHERFPEMVKIANENGFTTRVHTNATLLTPKKSREIIENGLNIISFSFDSEEKQKYENSRIGANYEKTLANIKTFLQIKKEIGSKTPHIILQLMREANETKAIEPNFKKTLKSKGIDEFIVRKVTKWPGKGGKDLDYKAEEFGKDYFPCHLLWASFEIFWDGKVASCCRDIIGENMVGNMEKEKLLDIWNNKAMVSLRENISSGKNRKYSLCGNCSLLWHKRNSKAPIKLVRKIASLL